MIYPEAYQYVRLCWKPKRGDRVIFNGQRFTVSKVEKGEGIKLKGRAGFLFEGQVLWRPTPSDFNGVLTRLAAMWVYRQLFDGNRQIVGVRCNGRIIPVRGRPARVLNQVLALRVIDSSISIHINRYFEQSYNPRGNRGNELRIHAVSSKTSGDLT